MSLIAISFFLIKIIVAMSVPLLPYSLLVAIATEGGIPANNIAGIVSIPPPPAIVSTHQAKTATKNSNIITSRVIPIQIVQEALIHYDQKLPVLLLCTLFFEFLNINEYVTPIH